MITLHTPFDLVRPPCLPRGGVVGIVAPSSPAAALFPERFQHAISVLEASLQVSVRVSPKVLTVPAGFCAGTGIERAAMINEFLADPEIDAIICTIGGFNSAEILPHIDVAMARSRPRIFVGYSDTSALLLGMQALAGWITFHGPMVMTQFGEFPMVFSETLEAFERAVRGGLAGTTLEDPEFWTDERLEWATNEWRTRSRRLYGSDGRSVWARGRGRGSGLLWGGNLETINLLFGTPYLTVPQRIILFWEATESEAYLPRIQRALTHLDQCGVLARTEAMLVGCSPHALPCDGVTLRDVVTQAAAAYDIPIIANLPIGHTDPLITLPIGTSVQVRVDGEHAEIRFLDEAVSQNPLSNL